MGPFGFGQSVQRIEDDRLVAGKGQYTDDMRLPGQAHAVMVRSPMAHARIVSIDGRAARDLPGVLGVFTGADAKAAGLGHIRCVISIRNRNGEPPFKAWREIVASERVRFVGDLVAFVVAETADIAKDATELVVVEYDELPAIADTEGAAAPDAPLVWQEMGSNVVLDWEKGDAEATARAFTAASHVTELRLVNNRLIANPLEPRSAIAEYESRSDSYTLYAGTQGVHTVRDLLAKHALNVSPDKLRVVTHDVGGGFGIRSYSYPEYAAILWASRVLGRPVKWTAERSDSFITDTHGRDHVTYCAAAFDANARLQAVRVRTIAAMGAYLSQYSLYIATRAGGGMQIGVYDVPSFHVSVKCVMTNTVPTDAYRGAGRPEALYVIERLMDKAAADLGLSPVELRRRNFVRNEQMPYRAANGMQYDSGDFDRVLTRALEAADWSGFERRRAATEAAGKLRGRGLSYYMERAVAGQEMARITIDADGNIFLAVGTQSTGQGHETTFPQLIAGALGVAMERVQLLPGDTSVLPTGTGTQGSRSLSAGGTALLRAVASIKSQGTATAAKIWNEDAAKIAYEDGAFRLLGTNRFLSLADVAAAVDEREASGEWTTTAEIQHDPFTFPNGCHICEVEVDPDTGSIALEKYSVIDDFGRILNPMIVAGQVQGGVAQGLGQAMGEVAIYDASGQLLTGSFMDYQLPRADDLPAIDVGFEEIPCASNELGIKGCGEAGTVGSPPAFVHAVLDALRPLGVTTLDMPLTPARVWRALQDAKLQC